MDRTRRIWMLDGYSFSSPHHIGVGTQALYAKKIAVSDDKSQYAQALIMLQLILSPEQGSPSVEEAFLGASEEEVLALTNFFIESKKSKLEEQQSSVISSMVSKVINEP